MTDTAQDMLIKSALAEIEQLKTQLATEKNVVNQVCQEVYDLEAKLREVEAERDDAGFRARLFEKAYEDLVVAVRKLSSEPTPAELAEADAWDAKCQARYSDYWYDYANSWVE